MIVTRDATHISVVVKGKRQQAERAAASQAIPVKFVRETLNGETVLLVDMQYAHLVKKWFDGYVVTPIGTPLTYSPTWVARTAI
jgi:hypothetical protein